MNHHVIKPTPVLPTAPVLKVKKVSGPGLEHDNILFMTAPPKQVIVGQKRIKRDDDSDSEDVEEPMGGQPQNYHYIVNKEHLPPQHLLNHNDPNGPRGKWTIEEDRVLKQAVEDNMGRNWKKISEHIPGRTDVQCLHRWQKVLKPGLLKGPWTPEEDTIVRENVKLHGLKCWSYIAKKLNGRLGKQCRERWFNHLDPNISKSPWSEEEDRIIIEQRFVKGNKWAQISKLLPGRTDNAIKNRWNSSLQKKINGDGNAEDDDDDDEEGDSVAIVTAVGPKKVIVKKTEEARLAEAEADDAASPLKKRKTQVK